MSSPEQARDDLAGLARLAETARRQESLLADLASGRPGDLDGVARATAEAADFAGTGPLGEALRAALARIFRLNAAVAAAVETERRRVGEAIASAARARRIGSDQRLSPEPRLDRTVF